MMVLLPNFILHQILLQITREQKVNLTQSKKPETGISLKPFPVGLVH